VTRASAAALVALCLMLPAGVTAVERVEIVIDSSAAMWRALGKDEPRFVAVREALLQHAASTLDRQGRPEIALRTVGGGAAAADPCRDTALALPFALADPRRWELALGDLVPQGPRPLVAALRQAAADLEDITDRRRLVLITSGRDDCFEDVQAALRSIVATKPAIELRVVGLGLDRDTIAAVSDVAPTRNVTDPAALAATLSWALQPADSRPAIARQYVIALSFLGGEPVPDGHLSLSQGTAAAIASAPLRSGAARLRVVPGRYRASVTTEAGDIELEGLVLGSPDAVVELELAGGPPLNLEIDPERPPAGGAAFIRPLAAPPDQGWVAVAAPQAPVGEYLLRTPLFNDDEVELKLPDAPGRLEARVLREAAPGVLQVLGRTSFETVPAELGLELPDRVEIGSPLAIAWRGAPPPGSRLTLAIAGADEADHIACLPVSGSDGSVSLAAPRAPGAHTVSLVSGWAQVLISRSLEAFEVLATLEAPARAEPGSELVVSWTGPDDPHDFLSIAEPAAPADTYLSWTPAEAGNPARLRAPTVAGSYELRYVRGGVAEVLARRGLEVVRAEPRITVPRTVAAGTRFEVQWRGTAAEGDLVVVAARDAADDEYFDFAYVGMDGPLTLAAPFAPGGYEVRYLSGADRAVLARRALRVQ
jgi:Ca-activated chloride channel family protein